MAKLGDQAAFVKAAATTRKAERLVKLSVSGGRLDRSVTPVKNVTILMMPRHIEWVQNCTTGGTTGIWNELIRRGIESVEKEFAQTNTPIHEVFPKPEDSGS